VRHYTREAGCRNLERLLAQLCRKAVLALEERGTRQVEITSEVIEDYLGPRRFLVDMVKQQDQTGLVNGLAWTEVGGEMLTIECAVTPGKGKTTTTGKLGEVMQESVQAAWTVVRSRAAQWGLDPSFYETIDLHIHLPEGATPKDGPSAGIGLATAMLSAVAHRPVHADVAMTGEITLRGEVLAIGGLKEKLLAAHRSGVKTVLIPESNMKDLRDVPENVKTGLTIRGIRWIDEVWHAALAPESAGIVANPVRVETEVVPPKPTVN
jgi:ATP-dependent Lon protease